MSGPASRITTNLMFRRVVQYVTVLCIATAGFRALRRHDEVSAVALVVAMVLVIAVGLTSEWT
jgi:hypothetical protein